MYHCPSCGRNDIELDPSGEKARNHRKRKGLRGSPWCEGSNEPKSQLEEIEGTW